MTKRRYFAATLLAGAASFTLAATSPAATENPDRILLNGVHVPPPPVHVPPPPVHVPPPPVHVPPPPVHVPPPPVHVPPPPVHVPPPPVHVPPPPVHVPPPPVHVPLPPVHVPPPPVHVPPPPSHNPGVPSGPGNPGHQGNSNPQLPGHLGKGPIANHPAGPQGGLNTGGHAPEFHSGGQAHQPFVVIQRTQFVREPVLASYSGNWIPLPNFEYCRGFYFGGVLYAGPDPFFWAYNQWAPTEWIYYADTGEWWTPGAGWAGSPAVGYNDVITVAVNEQVAVLDDFGDPVYDDDGNAEYETITVYYNAYWDPVYGAYGYLTRSGDYLWVQW